MAWAGTDIVPANINVQANYSINDAFKDTVTMKIVPKTSSGAIFDFTAATALTCQAQGQLNLPAQFTKQVSAAPTLVTGDATGLTLTFTTSNFLNLTGGMGTLNVPINIEATDGTTTLLVAKGTINCALVP